MAGTDELQRESNLRAHRSPDIARQTAKQNHMRAQEIAASYAPQIAALARPARTNASPD